MDVPEYRRQVEAELEQAAQQQTSFRELVGSRPAARRKMAPAAAALQDDDDLSAAVDVLRGRAADLELQTAALQVININIEARPELIDTLLELLRDATVPADLRRAILNVLQQISFRMVLFPGKRPDYLATLRSIIEDPDAQLRRRAIGILAREQDEYVQRRLIEGLEQRSRALVPAAKAIQFLGYDIHAEYFPMLRRIIEQPPSRAAKREAVRLLSADPASTDLLVALLNDKHEDPEVRRTAAVALQSLAPDRFEAQARRIVLDDDEDDELRAVSISALTQFANPAALRQDDQLNRRIEQLRAESGSRQVQQATAGYLSKHGAQP
jgi:HEAT repeats